MTTGIGLAVAAMVCYGLGDLVYKRAAMAGAAAHRFMMVQSWSYGVMVAVYGLATRTLVLDAGALWGALAGIFAYTGFYNFARSLRAGNVSINAPIFRLSFTITAALAVLLLGEPLTATKVAGLSAALGAVWLLLGASPGRMASDLRGSGAGLARVLVATVAVGIANLLYKVGLRAGATPAGLLLAQAFVVITIGTTMVAVLDRRVRPTRVTLRYAPLAALALAGGFILLAEALTRGQASVLVPIAQMGFVVTATIGFLVLREPFTPRKGVGLALALVALGCLSAS
jgi:drug/metabolite transporter (DMT)-like permease